MASTTIFYIIFKHECFDSKEIINWIVLIIYLIYLKEKYQYKRKEKIKFISHKIIIIYKDSH